MLLQDSGMFEEDRFDTSKAPIGFRLHLCHLSEEGHLGLLHAGLGLEQRRQCIF